MKRISDCYKTGEKRILGLMSGTSLDGLDLADITFQSKNKTTKISFHSIYAFTFNSWF